MNRLKEYFAFTKNEQKIFLILALVFIIGASLKIYRVYTTEVVPDFDYSLSDAEFEEKSKTLLHSKSTSRDSSYQENIPIIKKEQKVPEFSSVQNTKGKIDINTASKQDLVNLPGIGEGTAEKIILYRGEHGRFVNIQELRSIKGIGAKKFEQLKGHIEVK